MEAMHVVFYLYVAITLINSVATGIVKCMQGERDRVTASVTVGEILMGLVIYGIWKYL